MRRRSTEELDEEAAAAIEDPQDNPEVTFQNRRKAEVLLNCLTKLSPAHREIIDLVYYHEKSIDEVAEIVGIPPNTVKTRMFYARKQIAELMAAGIYNEMSELSALRRRSVLQSQLIIQEE